MLPETLSSFVALLAPHPNELSLVMIHLVVCTKYEALANPHCDLLRRSL